MDIAGSSLVPAVRYRNALAAIEWLCTAFGFHKHLVVSDENGRFLHAHLTFGNAMVTVLPIHDFGLDLHMKQPDEVGGAETQTCYIHVADAVAHHDRAKTEGAEIVLELRKDLHGGRGYSCRDPEGHIWSFGTYDPWEGAAPPAAVRTRDVPAATPPDNGPSRCQSASGPGNRPRLHHRRRSSGLDAAGKRCRKWLEAGHDLGPPECGGSDPAGVVA